MAKILDKRVEFTVRGVIIGAIITLAFTAANIYIGLKIGLTFASSIPAAVISMAVLRWFKNSTIYENNIVQTIASAAGTLSAVIFVLPGLVMVGWWTGFPYWESFGVCAIGGVLGVMYTIPLRRALVTDSDLPYPEGVAAAEVLIVGSKDARAAENRLGLITVAWGAVASAVFLALEDMRIFADNASAYFRAGLSSTGITIGLSFALLGAGHLIGLAVGIAIFAGLFLSWGVLVPIFTSLHPMVGDAATVAGSIYKNYVRFIGVGTIGVAAIWTIVKLAVPVWGGLLSSIESSRTRARGSEMDVPIAERDLPIGTVTIISLACLVPLAILLVAFLIGGPLNAYIVPIVAIAIVYVVVVGFVIAAVCGYMAGLIGSSNSPVSGLGILAILGISLALFGLARNSPVAAQQAAIAFALFVTAVVLCVATIANDNLQDLKTGQLIGANPARQQVALIVGTLIGAAVIPPILNMVNQAYGFVGSPMHGLGNAAPLNAPQAALLSTLAKSVIGGVVPWTLIWIGVAIGVVAILIDELLVRTSGGRLKFPPLAVGLGIYLPASATFLASVGAIAGYFYNRWAAGKRNPEDTKRLGILLASGLIVGEGILGVLYSGLIIVTKNGTPLAVVGDSFQPIANWLGPIAFVALAIYLYRWIATKSQTA
ncbi:MAG: oligopeptide transporter, OPT family [Candidatus Eremiobacteraeota bacterium]|nr:oligopeptide transporter, OPT family [Candidatus Eremiobacteraeota bacterium]